MMSKKHLPENVVHRMRTLCCRRTADGLQEAFGISYNTWRRIDAGEAIRASVAERIEQRVALLPEHGTTG